MQATRGAATQSSYRQLKPRHIRLLEVHEGQDLLQGSLRAAHLDDCPAFLALSYVWAQDVPVVAPSIHCDGQMLYATANCLSALWHLRQKLGSYIIWVDSICINQNDPVEKEQQLPLMGDIFVRAATTYVWLGPSSPGAERVLRFLCNSVQRYVSYDGRASYAPNTAALNLALAWVGIRRNLFPYGRYAKILRRPWFEKTYAYIDELLQLLDQPYLQRIWTYQEILLASSPTLLCGMVEIDWHHFSLAIQFQSIHADPALESVMNVWDELLSDRARLQSRPIGDDARYLAAVLSRYKLLKSWIVSISMIVLMMFVIIEFISSTSQRSILLLSMVLLLFFLAWAVAMLRDSSTNRAERSHIYRHKESLVTSIHARTALETRDKAFGVSAVLARRGAALQTLSYDDPIEGVYRSLAESVLRCTRSFDMLYLAAIESQAGCPSWVPNWDVQGSWPSRIDTSIAGLSRTVSRWHEHQYISELLIQEAEAATFAIRGNGLHVEAYQLGMCTAVARFREVDQSSVKALHIANFRAAMACVQWTGGRILEALSLSSAPPHWGEWLQLIRRRGLEQSLQDWEAGFAPDSVIDMLPVHTEICNTLARHDIMLCVARLRFPDTTHLKRRPTWYERYLLRSMFDNCARVAVCSPRVQVGDTIIRVKGMHMPLVLHGQRLISPFKMIRHAWHTFVLGPRIPLSPAQDVLYNAPFQRLEIL